MAKKATAKKAVKKTAALKISYHLVVDISKLSTGCVKKAEVSTDGIKFINNYGEYQAKLTWAQLNDLVNVLNECKDKLKS